MKKWLLKLSLVAMTLLLLPIQAVQACCGFIIGRQLTKDGTTLFGRTEDYPYYPNGGKHNKNFVVVDAKNYKEGDQLEDESNGFTYPHAASEMKYTATYDSARGDGSNGAFGEHGFNEAGVSMTSTVTAIPNKKVLKTDPLTENGIPEAAMLDVVLPRVKSAREGVEFLAKIIEEKGSAEGNVVVFADQKETWYMEILEERFQSKIIYFKVKNKEYGWRQLTTKVVFENGEVLYDTKDKNIFTLAYLQTNAFCRPSCYTCQFKGYPRIADITIADLWGKPGIIDKDMDHDLGTSLVLVNSRKGGNYYNKIVDKVKSKPIDFQTATVGNPALIKPLSAPKVDREEFFKDMECMSFKDLVRKYVKISSELPLSDKDKLKNTARFLLGVKRVCGWNLGTICKNIYYNLLCKAVKTNITEGKFMLIHKHCTLDIARTATIELGGILDFGSKRIRGSVLESRLLVDPHGKLITKGGVSIGYGADIEVFRDANLTFGADFSSNINATIICGHDITFDEKVSLGRDVTVRDNSGEHFISRRAYKNVRPVFIGKHSWLCEGSIIMPGTKLGAGVIVGARSFVAGGKFKNFTMLSGAPAVVVDEDVFVKM